MEVQTQEMKVSVHITDVKKYIEYIVYIMVICMYKIITGV